MMIWWVWLAMNKTIFEDIKIPSIVYASKSVAILELFPQSSASTKKRIIKEEVIDKFGSRRFFDSQVRSRIGGVGGIIYIIDNH